MCIKVIPAGCCDDCCYWMVYRFVMTQWIIYKTQISQALMYRLEEISALSGKIINERFLR
jgi:hypothetical protein